MRDFRHQVCVFACLAVAAIALAVARLVMQHRLLIRWREHTTGRLLAPWLASATPYRLGGVLDNPDQGLAQDVRAFSA